MISKRYYKPRRVPRKSDIGATTLKISLPVATHIEEHSKSSESVNRTLRRLLKMPGSNGHEKEGPQPFMRTIKVEQDVLAFISDRARPKESRDDTLRRLLKIRSNGRNIKRVGT